MLECGSDWPPSSRILAATSSMIRLAFSGVSRFLRAARPISAILSQMILASVLLVVPVDLKYCRPSAERKAQNQNGRPFCLWRLDIAQQMHNVHCVPASSKCSKCADFLIFFGREHPEFVPGVRIPPS